MSTNAHNAADAYRAGAIENAPPLKILRMLYAGAIRFLERAKAIDPGEDPLAFTDALGRADAIVAELRCALDRDHAPEVVDPLESLYLFIERQIAEAQLERSSAPLEPSVRVLTTLLDAWNQVDAGTAEEALRPDAA